MRVQVRRAVSARTPDRNDSNAVLSDAVPSGPRFARDFSRVPLRGDGVYERHADAVADRVVRNESVEGLLDAIPAGGTPAPVLQRAEKTKYGTFDTTRYTTVQTPRGSNYGVDIELTFDPAPAAVDASKIGLVQTVRTATGGKGFVTHPSQHERMVKSGAGEGQRIDRTPTGQYANPLYAAKTPGAADTLADTPTSAGWGQHGWHYTENGAIRHQKAILIDKPTLGDLGVEREQTFETAALAIEGKQAGTYMGSVEWGWREDARGKFTRLDVRKKSDGVPTPGFMAAAKLWNTSKTPGVIKTAVAPTQVFDTNLLPAFTVEKDVEIAVISAEQDGGISYNEIEIKSGTEAGKTGYIRTNDLQDTGGGRATIPLPIQRTSTIRSATGSGVELKPAHDEASDTLASVPDGTIVNVIREWGRWAEVEVDANAGGIVLGALATPDIAGMVRGYVPRDTTP